MFCRPPLSVYGAQPRSFEPRFVAFSLICGTHKRLIEKELEGFGIRLNKQPPNISFKKKEKGGISITKTVNLTHIDEETVKAVLSESLPEAFATLQ